MTTSRKTAPKATDAPDEPAPETPDPEEATPVPSTPEPGKSQPADQPVENPNQGVDPNVYPDPDNLVRHP